MEKEFKYFAFISYSSKDTAWGKRLQRKLENYRMPATICNEHGWKRKPLSPIFFAPTDIQPGGLDNELQERLRASRNLIVICSPNSAKSDWVGLEIEYFHNLGRAADIHFFIVDGMPHSGDPDTECFNPVIDRLGMPEILGANIHEKNYRWPWMNRQRAYVQLVSKLLGVEFDSIWRRHRRLLVQRCIGWAISILAVLVALFAVWQNNQPFDSQVRLGEVTVHNDQLPPLHDAVVTMTLDNETKVDTIRTIDNQAIFANIPHRFMGQLVHITMVCGNDFLPIDTMVTLARHIVLNINRNAGCYGNIRFTLWDDGPVAELPVTVAGHETASDNNGVVSLYVPLDQQRTCYPVTAAVPLDRDSIYAPFGKDDIIELR